MKNMLLIHIPITFIWDQITLKIELDFEGKAYVIQIWMRWVENKKISYLINTVFQQVTMYGSSWGRIFYQIHS